MSAKREPTFLGDGVNVTSDGYYITLTVEGRKSAVLDPSVFGGLVRFAVTSGVADPEVLKELIDEATER